MTFGGEDENEESDIGHTERKLVSKQDNSGLNESRLNDESILDSQFTVEDKVKYFNMFLCHSIATKNEIKFK